MEEEMASSWWEPMSPEDTDPEEMLSPHKGSGKSFTDTGLSTESKAGPDAATPSSSKRHGIWLYQ